MMVMVMYISDLFESHLTEEFDQVCNILHYWHVMHVLSGWEVPSDPMESFVQSLFHFIVPQKIAMPGFVSSHSPSRCCLTVKWMSGKLALNFYVMISGWNLFYLGNFCYQGAPARGASVKLFDENGRVQKRVIDAGRYRPLDNAL
jgi:hypothetical protein